MSNTEIFHECRSAGIRFTGDQWSDYCQRARLNPEEKICTDIGKYTFSDCDICLNPEQMSLVVDGESYGYYVFIKWCDCGNGFWNSAIDYGYGNGGGCSGVSYADRLIGDEYDSRAGYRSEADAKVAACDKALLILTRQCNEDSKMKRLIKMVEDYKRTVKPKYIQLELF